MKKKGTILIVDDNKSILSALRILLSNIFENVIVLSSPNQLLTTIRSQSIDVILLDMNFSSGVNNGNEGLFWLSEIKSELSSRSEVVLITAYADIELAIKGMKLGACDFVVKPWDNSKLLEVLNRAYMLSVGGGKRKILSLKSEPTEMFWGRSRRMLELKELVDKVATTDANILITGENGTGKEVLAREIHRLSNRASKQMVTVDMGAITETLFESELFGHTKGAFTDAKADRAGKFEVANGGTIFLDEIGNLPLHLQAKLLTVLQTRQVIRVGSNSPIDIDIRLISATNQNIEKMVDDGEFRMDLMYRMNTITIDVIPLRERRADIVPLANLFIEKYNSQYNKKIVGVTPDAQTILANHHWSGNIRELQHAVEKAVIVCSSTIVKSDDFRLSEIRHRESSGELEFTTFEDMERKMIEVAIAKYESNLSMVASSLGISRQTLYNKMKRYNI